jgi:hypothetical protein
MKDSFSPYLKDVLPAIFTMATLQPKIGLSGTDEIGDIVDVLGEVTPAATSATTPTPGEIKKLNVHTDEIEEKDTALQMLAVFIEECGAGFAPYIVDTSKIIVSMLEYGGNDNIRSSSADCIPYLVKSAKAAGGDQANLQMMAKEFI